MKRIVFTLVALFGLLMTANAAPESTGTGTLHHVVALKFKPGTQQADIKKIETAFVALKKSIPQVASLKWGTDVSPEKLSKGYTHCFVLTFKGDADRDAYLVHPEHKAFGKALGPVLEDVIVIDFWSKE